ncbi:MAG TPA: peptidylprolyl isomerase [Prolixibacteraceae bacterium]|nr:peptidylprolyl isomerase [Prolixibacteraceae bacterium]
MKQRMLMLMFAVLLMNTQCTKADDKKETRVEIETEFGTIKIKLYNEMPLHRDNFLKLVDEGFYTDLLFHRVIQSFMIQGGDPDSRNATPEQRLGGGDLGYTLPAEINPKFFHHRGVLAAARQGDQVNPEKRSSASQFYILQGKIFRPTELDTLLMKLEENRKAALMQARMKAIEPELNKLSAEGRQGELMAKINAIRDSVTTQVARLAPLTFTEEQRKAYTTTGGYPSLDNNYTIYGEVVEGMEVVDAIAKQQVNEYNRPLKDIRFSIKRD